MHLQAVSKHSSQIFWSIQQHRTQKNIYIQNDRKDNKTASCIEHSKQINISWLTDKNEIVRMIQYTRVRAVKFDHSVSCTIANRIYWICKLFSQSFSNPMAMSIWRHMHTHTHMKRERHQIKAMPNDGTENRFSLLFSIFPRAYFCCLRSLLLFSVIQT